MTLRKEHWNTYRTTGYTHDVANDPSSQGGVHHHQVRLTKSGWKYRICQSNGKHTAYGPVAPIGKEEGEARFLSATQG